MSRAIPTAGERLMAQLESLPALPNGLGIQCLGHHGYVVKYGSTVIYIDPYLSYYLDELSRDRPAKLFRRFPPPIVPEEVFNADYVVCTHDHPDHLDPGTILALAAASPQARFIAPLVAKAHLLKLGVGEERIKAVRVDDMAARFSLPDGTQVTAVKACHDGFHYNEATGCSWLGFVFHFGGVTLYHAGDTQLFDGLIETLQELRIDVAILPINGGTYRTRSLGCQGNMGFAEAADLGVAIRADWIIPSHHGLLSDNDEKVSRFVEYAKEHYPSQKIHVLALGETILYLKL